MQVDSSDIAISLSGLILLTLLNVGHFGHFEWYLNDTSNVDCQFLNNRGLMIYFITHPLQITKSGGKKSHFPIDRADEKNQLFTELFSH